MNAQSNDKTIDIRKDGADLANHFWSAPSFRMNFSLYGPSKIDSAPVVTLSMHGGGVSDPH